MIILEMLAEIFFEGILLGFYKGMKKIWRFFKEILKRKL